MSKLTGAKGTLVVCLLAVVIALFGAGIIYASTVIGGYRGPSSSSSGPPLSPEQFLRRFIANMGALNLIFEYSGGSSGTATLHRGKPNPGMGWSMSDLFGPNLPWHPNPKKGPPKGEEFKGPDTLGSFTNLFQGYSGYNPFFTPSSGGGGSGSEGDDLNLQRNGQENPGSPAVPVPAPVLLLGSGLIAFFFIKRRRSS